MFIVTAISEHLSGRNYIALLEGHFGAFLYALRRNALHPEVYRVDAETRLFQVGHTVKDVQNLALVVGLGTMGVIVERKTPSRLLLYIVECVAHACVPLVVCHVEVLPASDIVHYRRLV